MGQILLLLDGASPVVNFDFSGWNLLPLCGLYDLGTGHHHCFHAGWYLFHHSYHKTSFSIAFISYIFQILSPLKSLVLCNSQVDVIMLVSGGHNEDATAVHEIRGRGTRIQRRSRRSFKGNFNKVTTERLYEVIMPLSFFMNREFQVIKNEGFFSLWKGFTPYYFRLGPHTVLTFIFLEQVTHHALPGPLCPNRSLFRGLRQGWLKSTRNSYLNTGFFPRAQFFHI